MTINSTSNFDDFNDDEFDPSDFPGFQPAQPPVSETKNTYRGIEIPPSFTVDAVDIDNPSGFLGEMVSYFRDGAHRIVYGGAYTITAIQVSAAAAGCIKGMGDCKLSLVSVIMGLSSGGKERCIEVAKDLCNEIGVSVSGDVRSDKDIIRAMMRRDGRCVYFSDEGHTFLGVDASKGSSHMIHVTDMIMQLATTGIYNLSEVHYDEFSSSAKKTLSRLEKELDAVELNLAGYNEVFETEKIQRDSTKKEKITNEIRKAQALINRIETGVAYPSVNLCAFSTPIKLADLINEDSIEKGFLGRALVADCGGMKSPYNPKMRDERGLIKKIDLSKERSIIIEKMKHLHAASVKARDLLDNGSKFDVNYVISDDAAFILAEIIDFYDQEEYLDGSCRMHSIYGRLVARTQAIASVMAILDANNIYKKVEITARHIVESFKISLNTLAEIRDQLSINEGSVSRNASNRLEALRGAIIKALEVKNKNSSGWRYEARIKDGISRRKWYADLVETARRENPDQCVFANALSQLSASGIIERNGKQIRLKI